MKPSNASLAVPILLITFGIGWLLTTLNVAPDFDWTWTLGLAALALVLYVVLGIDKVTVICAPLLLAASIFSVLEQRQILGIGLIVPILVILTGILLLVARRPSIPAPKWISDSTKSRGGD